MSTATMSVLCQDLRVIHLNPGEWVATREPSQIATVLGSCVSVTMFHVRLSLAAMCHAMLPHPRRATDIERFELERFRYVTEVIPAMAETFRAAGVVAAEIEVKLFGGGNVLRGDPRAPVTEWLGSINVRTAREVLEEHGLVVRAANVGGTSGRKILFNTGTGEVLHKHLGS